jgi:hypothetical protein
MMTCGSGRSVLDSAGDDASHSCSPEAEDRLQLSSIVDAAADVINDVLIVVFIVILLS